MPVLKWGNSSIILFLWNLYENPNEGRKKDLIF